MSVVGRYAVLWRGVCRAFQNSSSDSCRSAWDVHSPLIGGYPRELRFTRLVSELYMPTAGTRSADRIDASRAGFRRSRQCSRVGRRQYGHRIGITKRPAGRYRTSQCSEELWYSVSGQARQAKLGDIPFSEGGFLGEHLESERQALSAPSRGQRGERGYPRQLWIRTKKYRPEISRDPSGSVNLFGPNLSRILDKKGIVARFPPCVTLRVICVGRSFVRPPLWAQRAPRKRHPDQFLDFRKDKMISDNLSAREDDREVRHTYSLNSPLGEIPCGLSLSANLSHTLVQARKLSSRYLYEQKRPMGSGRSIRAPAIHCFGGGFFFTGAGAAGLGGGATGASCANTGFGANFGSDTPICPG